MGKLIKLILVVAFFGIAAQTLVAYPTSKAVREEIVARMDAQPNLGAHDIEIDVRHGEVTLVGVVSSELDSATIGKIANEIQGIKGVKNYLVVSHPISSGSVLAKQIRQKLKSDTSLSGYDLDIKVREGVAHISGEVRARPDLSKIEALSKEVVGIDAVETDVSVQPELSDKALIEQVRLALSRESDIKLDSVNITALNGVVTFEGIQTNHRDIDRILSVALMVKGVKDVQSNMKVGKVQVR